MQAPLSRKGRPKLAVFAHTSEAAPKTQTIETHVPGPGSPSYGASKTIPKIQTNKIHVPGQVFPSCSASETFPNLQTNKTHVLKS